MPNNQADTAFEQFAAWRRAGYTAIAVTRALPLSFPAPLEVYAALGSRRGGGFFLESADEGGRFSFIGLGNFGQLISQAGKTWWRGVDLDEQQAFGEDCPDTSLAAAELLLERWRAPSDQTPAVLSSGLVGFFGWETIRQVEEFSASAPENDPVPEAAFLFVRDLLVIDHKLESACLITVVLDTSFSPQQQWQDAQHRLEALQAELAAVLPPAPTVQIDRIHEYRPEFTPEQKADFLALVQRAKEHIVRGDVFQVVFSRRFERDYPASPLQLYRVLRVLNPSPYMFLLDLTDANDEPYALVGASPEALVRIEKDTITSCPIAGTQPRKADPQEEDRLAAALLQDPKERAEHIMLVDLVRNDISRVCEPGTCQVTRFMEIDRYSHVMHIVSMVQGKKLPHLSALAVFKAVFPAGTLSGAPKIMAMELISRYEPYQRGLYGGAVGYFDFSGNADLAITIRSALIRKNKAIVQAGAGIVADSDPEAEFQETNNKAAAVLLAIELAVQA